MPYIASAAKIDFENRVDQQQVKEQVRQMFAANFPQVDRLIAAFDNTEIVTRNFCKPLNWYSQPITFEERNNAFIEIALEYSIKAIEQACERAKVFPDQLTDIYFITTTGLATPSIDARIINKMRLNPNINRTPIWGLGCAGGVSGLAKAATAAKANPDAIVAFIAVELCSLTLIRTDYSKSNFIGSSLFSDGVCACIIKGDNHAAEQPLQYIASGSKLYPDSLDVMGWDFNDEGFKVLFSKDIPTIINQYVKDDIESFLARQGLKLSDIKSFIFHPGGKKVLDAYADSLKVEGDFLKHTREVMGDNGNMSSATVLYVLERFMQQGIESGYALMLAMGPGFSSEMVLLKK